MGVDVKVKVKVRVCKEWRKAQLKVGGRLRTRVGSDVVAPGSVALAKWALAEGCPREGYGYTLAKEAAWCGHKELVEWLCGEGGFAMSEGVMNSAAGGGNLELVKWLRGEGCPWGLPSEGCPDSATCFHAINYGRVEVLRWARENGCPWWDEARVWAYDKLGYTDDLGNLVDYNGNPVQ